MLTSTISTLGIPVQTVILLPSENAECGMPIQLARCLECGAPIGGNNHQVVEGVVRATAMENGENLLDS